MHIGFAFIIEEPDPSFVVVLGLSEDRARHEAVRLVAEHRARFPNIHATQPLQSVEAKDFIALPLASHDGVGAVVWGPRGHSVGVKINEGADT
jgi:hypothetical protein